MKVCKRFLVHLEKTKLHHIVCALQRPANRNFVQSLRPNQTFKNVSLGISYIFKSFLSIQVKSTSIYPQKLRQGKLCTDLGFVNKLYCRFPDPLGNKIFVFSSQYFIISVASELSISLCFILCLVIRYLSRFIMSEPQ